MNMTKFQFKASRAFWKSLSKLPERQQTSAKVAFNIFKANPFDPRLRTHKINSMSAYYGKTIYAVEIEGDLRAAFYVEGDVVFTVDIGSHAIYRV
jgi:mRNA-degrading endonuclease YafQ of YafQ-DinJ toxin-antitoxin module